MKRCCWSVAERCAQKVLGRLSVLPSSVWPEALWDRDLTAHLMCVSVTNVTPIAYGTGVHFLNKWYIEIKHKPKTPVAFPFMFQCALVYLHGLSRWEKDRNQLAYWRCPCEGLKVTYQLWSFLVLSLRSLLSVPLPNSNSLGQEAFNVLMGLTDVVLTQYVMRGTHGTAFCEEILFTSCKVWPSGSFFLEFTGRKFRVALQLLSARGYLTRYLGVALSPLRELQNLMSLWGRHIVFS